MVSFSGVVVVVADGSRESDCVREAGRAASSVIGVSGESLAGSGGAGA